MREGIVEIRMTRFLFQYRTTPDTTTGVSPPELLLGVKLRSLLDLLHTDVGRKVRQSQNTPKQIHNFQAREILMYEGKDVYASNFKRGLKGLAGTDKTGNQPNIFYCTTT